eukprot:2326139-Prymnesium_polylepis.1
MAATSLSRCSCCNPVVVAAPYVEHAEFDVNIADVLAADAAAENEKSDGREAGFTLSLTLSGVSE